jgi:hypothetical protein
MVNRLWPLEKDTCAHYHHYIKAAYNEHDVISVTVSFTILKERNEKI